MAKQAKPKEVEKPKPECCLTCKYFLTCAEIAGAKCRNYTKREMDKKAISTRYLELLKGISDLVTELVMVETEMQIVEKVGTLPPTKPEERPPISARNKQVVEMVDKGFTIEEIASQLELKPETIRKEIEHLINIGILKGVKVKNKLNGKKATLLKKDNNIVVLATP